MNVRFCRNGHSTQLKNAYLAYIWQTSSAKRHFGGTIWRVLANRPAIYKRDSSGQGCVSTIYKADTHPFGLFASEFLQRAHTGLSGRRLRVRTFRMRRWNAPPFFRIDAVRHTEVAGHAETVGWHENQVVILAFMQNACIISSAFGKRGTPPRAHHVESEAHQRVIQEVHVLLVHGKIAGFVHHLTRPAAR